MFTILKTNQIYISPKKLLFCTFAVLNAQQRNFLRSLYLPYVYQTVCPLTMGRKVAFQAQC